jgi:hypothetical protein
MPYSTFLYRTAHHLKLSTLGLSKTERSSHERTPKVSRSIGMISSASSAVKKSAIVIIELARCKCP